MIYKDIIQGSEEWHKLRLGKVTASRIVDIMPGVKGKYLAGRKNYMAELVCEILTGEPGNNFISEPMQWGTDNEPLARSAYEATTGNMVEEAAFITHPNMKDFGASPDGLINNNRCIEIKCPNTATHIETLIKGKVKRDYIFQMQAVMMCGYLDWCDYVSFDPRLPDHLQLYIKRFEKDINMVADIKYEVVKFQKELGTMLKELKNYKE